MYVNRSYEAPEILAVSEHVYGVSTLLFWLMLGCVMIYKRLIFKIPLIKTNFDTFSFF